MRSLIGLLLASAVLAQDILGEASRKMAAGDYQGAAADYGKAIEGASGDARGYEGRARALQKLGRHADAVKDLSKAIDLRRKEPSARLHADRAFSYWMLKDHDAALADCDTSLAIEPSAFAHRVRGDALHGKREDAEALKAYDLAVKLDPDDATALHRRGDVKLALKDFRGAAGDFWALTAVVPESPVPYALSGRAMMHLDEPRAAVELFAQALERGDKDGPERALHAASARAWWTLGENGKADTEAAKADAERAPPDALAEAGRYWFDTGRTKEALADFQRAVDADPGGQDYTRLYLFLARARLGERPLAAGELRTYLDRAKRDDWYARVGGFLCGRVKEQDLLAAAKSGTPLVAAEQECEACWYAGAVRLLDGDAKGAKALFERSVATDVRTFIEYESAKMALAAMDE